MSVRALRVMLVGVGLHAARAHLPILRVLTSGRPVELVAALDLEDAAHEARSRLEAAGFPRVALYGIRASSEDDGSPTGLGDALAGIVARHGINTVVIATDAESHWPYLEWAVAQGFHVMVDKPVLAVRDASGDTSAAATLTERVGLLERALRTYPGTARVLVHRRANPAYRLVAQEVASATDQTGCHITGLVAEHSDGEWRMPDELVAQRYHRVDRGVGVLSHSGYHVLDSAMWWLASSGLSTTPDVTATAVDPVEAFGQLPDSSLRRAFPTGDLTDRLAAVAEQEIAWGEWDTHLQIQHRDGGRLLSRSDLHLLHSGFSHRGWLSSAGRDLYTGNGRIGHEVFSIHQGPFQAIKLLALQGGALSRPESPYDVEGPRHCEVHIFRNTHFLRGDHYERITLEALEPAIEPEFLGLGPGKVALYQEFVEAALDGRRDSHFHSSLAEHIGVMRVYASGCRAIAEGRSRR